jgi:drug/metabolite transporter (DMT)-like permease
MTLPSARPRDPIATGTWLAVLAAVCFGVTTPLIQRLSRDVGPFLTAALLYAGAAIASLSAARRKAGRAAPIRLAHAGNVVVIALFGAVLAPACLAWGLKTTSGVAASLLLNLEAAFTSALAYLAFRESIGRRVVLAMLAMFAAGGLLAFEGASLSSAAFWGSIAVAGASLGWALDNTLTRTLADLDATQVVFWKATIGAALSATIGCLLSEPLPTGLAALALLACGATGYGLSLRFYLLAQRTLGAARTASVFAVAPFVGAACAFGMGERSAGPWFALASALFAFAVYLHVTERHGHLHAHARLEHEHAHRHDDGHHEHRHEFSVAGEHSHLHEHDETVHDHPHAPDLHHRHRHD